MAAALDEWDIIATRRGGAGVLPCRTRWHPHDRGLQPEHPLGQPRHRSRNGCIRSVPNAYFQDGGLAVLFGNIAENGCIVDAGVDEEIFTFSGPARVFESQDSACDGILNTDHIQAGDVVIIRYEGPKGGPGMQEMLYPTSYIKCGGSGRNVRSSPTDASPATSGLSIGRASPEAAEGGAIALIEDGDIVDIDIPNRTINIRVTTR